MLRIDTSGGVIRVASLLSDRLDLVKGFHKYWPQGYTMELHPDNLGYSLHYNDAKQPAGYLCNQACRWY